MVTKKTINMTPEELDAHFAKNGAETKPMDWVAYEADYAAMEKRAYDLGLIITTEPSSPSDSQEESLRKQSLGMKKEALLQLFRIRESIETRTKNISELNHEQLELFVKEIKLSGLSDVSELEALVDGEAIEERARKLLKNARIQAAKALKIC